jgi:hypothetical protein
MEFSISSFQFQELSTSKSLNLKIQKHKLNLNSIFKHHKTKTHNEIKKRIKISTYL